MHWKFQEGIHIYEMFPMFHWLNLRYYMIGVMLAVGLGTTLYRTTWQRVEHSLVRFHAPQPSIPVHSAYASIPSLPNVYIDQRVGFVPHFIAFTYNWDSLNQCLRSLHESNVAWRNVIIVDNSAGQLVVKKRYWLVNEYGTMIVTILPIFSFLSFSHLQNLFLSIAQQSKCYAYSWSHMDIVLLPFEEDWRIFKNNRSTYNDSASLSQTIYHKFLGSIHHTNHTKNQWGLIFYAYDLLAAVRTSAYTTTGPFDISIPQYKADCDYYKRLELKGYQKIQKHIVHIFHMPNVLERKLREEMKSCEWYRAKEILYIAANNSSRNEDRTNWRLNDMRRADREAASILTPAGWTYFKRKWGTDDCDPKSAPNWNLDPVIS